MPNRTEDPFIIRDLEVRHKVSNLNQPISLAKNLYLPKAKLSKANATEHHPCLINHILKICLCKPNLWRMFFECLIISLVRAATTTLKRQNSEELYETFLDLRKNMTIQKMF